MSSRNIIAEAVLPWMIQIYPGDESKASDAERQRMAEECAEAVLNALSYAAREGDEWVSGHDLMLRVGALVMGK